MAAELVARVRPMKDRALHPGTEGNRKPLIGLSLSGQKG